MLRDATPEQLREACGQRPRRSRTRELLDSSEAIKVVVDYIKQHGTGYTETMEKLLG